VVAEEFTIGNIRRAVTGIARYIVSQHPEGARVVIGRDPRYMGERFVELAAEILRRRLHEFRLLRLLFRPAGQREIGQREIRLQPARGGVEGGARNAERLRLRPESPGQSTSFASAFL